MKKRNKLTLILTALFFAFSLVPFLPASTHADMAGPMTFSVDYVITNKNGLATECFHYENNEYKKETINIPYNTKLNGTYMWVQRSEEDKTEYQEMEYSGKRCTIKKQDVELASKVFDFSTIEESSSPLSQYIVSDESYLYKGPDESYGKVDDEYHLPKGIIVTATYYDGLWMYIEYEGHSGWINHYSGKKTANIASDEWNRTLIVTRDKIDLKDTPYEDGKVIATMNVTPLTGIPVLYYIPAGKYSTYVYISYGQYSGWYYKDSTSYDIAYRAKETTEGITIKETEITSTVDSEADSSTIPANTEFNVLYTAIKGWGGQEGTKSYVRTKSTSDQFFEGWIDGKGYATGTYKDGKYTEITLDYDQIVFDGVDGNGTSNVAKAGTYKIFYYYTKTGKNHEIVETWYYLGKQKSSYEYETVGWIRSLSNKEIEMIEEAKREELKKQMENEDPDDLVLYKIPDEIDPKATMIPTIIWFLVGSIVVSISIIVALAITKHIKKSKETDDSEPKSEKSDDETKEESEEEAGENSENREENEKKEDLKSEKTDDEIEENFDEFLDENSPKFEEKGDGFEPDSEKEPEETKPKSKKAKLEDKEKGEKDA